MHPAKDGRALSMFFELRQLVGLFAIATPVVAADNGFEAEALTLAPGKPRSEINLAWYGNSADGRASSVKIVSLSEMSGDTFPPKRESDAWNADLREQRKSIPQGCHRRA